MNLTADFIQGATREILERAGFPTTDVRFDIQDGRSATIVADISVVRRIIVKSNVQQGRFSDGTVHPSHDKAKDSAQSEAKIALDKRIAEGTLEQDMTEHPAAYLVAQKATSPISEHLVVASCANCKSKGKLICANCSGKASVVCSRCRGAKQDKCGYCDGTGQPTCHYCNGTTRINCVSCDSRGHVYVDVQYAVGEMDRHTVDCGSCGRMGFVRCTNCYHSQYHGRAGYCSPCSATGKVDCSGCKGRGAVDCSTCKASGEVGCNNCASTGHLTTSYVGEINSTVSCSYAVLGENENSSQLENIMASILTDASCQPALRELTPRGADVDAQYSWSVPFVSGLLSAGNHSYGVDIWGQGRHWLSVPPLLDDLLAPLEGEAICGPAFFEELSRSNVGTQILGEFIGTDGDVPLSTYGGMLSRGSVATLGGKAIAEVGSLTSGISQKYWWIALVWSLILTGVGGGFVLLTKELPFWDLIQPKWVAFAGSLFLLSLINWVIAAQIFDFASRRWVMDLTGIAPARPLRAKRLSALTFMIPAMLGLGSGYWMGSPDAQFRPAIEVAQNVAAPSAWDISASVAGAAPSAPTSLPLALPTAITQEPANAVAAPRLEKSLYSPRNKWTFEQHSRTDAMASVLSPEARSALVVDCNANRTNPWLQFYPEGWTPNVPVQVIIDERAFDVILDGGDGVILSNLPGDALGIDHDLLNSLMTGTKVSLKGPATAKMKDQDRIFSLSGARESIARVLKYCRG